MLNTVASKTIRHLFTQSESVEVLSAAIPPANCCRGIDSFKMSGRGFHIRKDLELKRCHLRPTPL